MYTATITYCFDEKSFEKACGIWKKEVFNIAANQQGFVRMQFLVSPPEAIAIGTWENMDYAVNFMKTGVYKKLLEKIDKYFIRPPVQKSWVLKYFSENID